jgi:signal transduction histidine kinase
MQSVIDYLFGSAASMPHGVCLLWQTDLLALHAISDVLIFVSYASIPMALLVFVRRRPELEHRWAITLFAAFILFCGLSHLMAAFTVWFPFYGLQGLVKAATAAISVLTAFAIWPLIPKLLLIPSPAALQKVNAELGSVNSNLKTEIAEHRETLRELNEMRRELELRVEERTRALGVANCELERMNVDLSTFVHVASHDLKEPLRGIRHYAEIIADDHGEQLPQSAKDDLSSIARLADRMVGLINSLREYTRAGEAEAVIEDVDINDVLHAAMDNLRSLLSETGTTVEVVGTLPRARCVRAHVLTVLQNLISNAAHHSKWRAAKVTVEAHITVDGVTLKVADNGPGIPENIRDDVFKLFRRAANEQGEDSSNKEGLAGMGLAIVKRIVERNNGSVKLGSSPDGGAQFDLLMRPA